MFSVFFLFHMFLFLESFLLFRKKLRKRSILLGSANLIMTIVNLVRWIPIFQVSYSSVVFFQREIVLHPILNLFWILLNILFFGLVVYVLKYAINKKKQNSYITGILSFLGIFLLLYFVVLLFSRNASFLLLIVFLFFLSFLIKSYLKSKKNYLVILSLLLFIGVWYSYFTYTGSARFEILLKGYVTEAYETGLEEIKFFEEKNRKKFSPIQKIDLGDGVMGIIEVKNYGFLKFAKSTKDFKN